MYYYINMLYLTYYTGHNDGFGSQYQRILGAYSICKHFDIEYIHTPIADIEYQGLSALEKNKNERSFVDECNNRIQISCVSGIHFNETINVIAINQFQLMALKDRYKGITNTLVRLRYPYSITDIMPDIYANCLSLYKTHIPTNSIFTIGMHVRRGELFVVDSDRMLPNSFYIQQARKIISICENMNIPYIIELYTEIPEKDITITSQHPGINNRIKSDITIKRYNHYINEFDILPNLNKYINEDLFSTFDRMINCDILIASRSSMSTCASYLKKGISIYHKFWHGMRSKDIEYRDSLFNKKIENYINKKNDYN